MIVVTGAAGFIGSCLISHLNHAGYKDILLVDDFGRTDKNKNLKGKHFIKQVERNVFIQNWLSQHAKEISFIFHLGARTDTAETNVQLFDQLNLNYSKTIWQICTKHQIPLVYASSAATYGSGSLGYRDEHSIIPALQPLNPYGCSKNDFDKWVLEQDVSPPFWAGLKFFNVYGPNEYHKGRMASVIFHCYHQVKQSGKMRLFRSHKAGIQNGHQQRDFIYVKDVVNVCTFLMQNKLVNGVYNLGTGKARTFLDLTQQTFLSMGLSPDIEFIDTPTDIRETYQYFTQADMKKLRDAGYKDAFYELEEGIQDYVQSYLSSLNYY